MAADKTRGFKEMKKMEGIKHIDTRAINEVVITDANG